jgi:threonine dehydrogenase-like Zn-dependent dehydrogenase
MQALVWDGVRARLVDHPAPEPRPGMAVVRVHLAGICNTDLEITRGYMSFRGVLGHECVGTVDDGPARWRGKRVVTEINFACGACVLCVRGLGRHCPSRRVMGILGADGAFAEKVTVPIENLHLVPERVADDAAVFTEPLAAAFEILEQVHVQPAMACVVLGDGKLGLLVAQVLHQAGARVLAVGKHDSKLAILRPRGIETATLSEWDRTPADLVVDATGSAAGLAAAIAATRPRGTVVLKSTVAEVTRLDVTPLVINEITVLGSRCGSFVPALRALETGSVDVRPLLHARLPLRDGVDGLQRAAAPGVLKFVLSPQS